MSDYIATTIIDPATGRPKGTRLTFPGKGNETSADSTGSLDALPEYKPAGEAKGSASPSSGATLDALPDFQPSQDTAPEDAGPPAREVGTGEAALSGAKHAVTFGLAPALAGVKEAGQAPGGGLIEQGAHALGTIVDRANPITGPANQLLNAAGLPSVNEAVGIPSTGDLWQGFTRLIHNGASSDSDPAVVEAYNRGREAALQDEKLAQEQHPHAYLAGLVGGSLLTPTPGLGAARVAGTGVKAFLAARALNAARAVPTAAATGAANAVGEGISEGQSAPEIAARGARGAVISGAAGGLIGSALPRAASTVSTRGERAAQTAADLGAPIPRGLASDNAAINAATASARSVPVVGSRISSAVNATQHAAGEHVEGVARGMTGGTLDRAAADTIVRPGLQQAVEHNRGVIDALYNGTRRMIDQRARFTMPRTQAALNAVVAARREAGHANPEAGLEQFRNVSRGATFNGAHRARVDAREAGNPIAPHPGYNAADYNRITRAMTADLRAMAAAASRDQSPQGRAAVVAAFDQAERAFGPLSELNSRLNTLANGRGEGAIATLLGAAKEKGGDVRLLAQLRASMPAAEFNQIGGILLHELGAQPATGEFSLAKFVTEFAKTSPRARGILFSPQHLRDIENIVEMGQHIKGALRESNTSHTSNALILFDLARDAVMVGAGVAMGIVSGTSVATGGAAAAPAIIFAHWLSSPAQAAAMSRWTTAYRAVTLGQPTPARIAAFKIATRNLANNLGLPVDQVMQRIQGRLTARADETSDDEGPK